MDSRYIVKRVEKTFTDNIINEFLFLEDKRTYFSKLELSNECNLYINNLKVSDKSMTITVNDINRYTISNNINISNIFTVVNDAKISQEAFIKFLLPRNNLSLKIEPAHKADDSHESHIITYEYIIDLKSTKKQRKPTKQPSPVNEPNTQDFKEQSAAWVNKQIEMANKIWREVSQSLVNEEFNKLDDHDKLIYYQNKYPNFNRQHPLTIRFMVEEHRYSAKVFEKYIKRVVDSKVGDPNEFIDRQADYATLLWKEFTADKHYDPKKAKAVWENAHRIIKKESDTFKKIQDTAEELAEKVESKYEHEMKIELERQIEELRRLDNYKEHIYKTTMELKIDNIVDNHIATTHIANADDRWSELLNK